MNPELKKMMRLAFLMLAILVVVINIYSLRSSNHITGVTFRSQQAALNRLKRPKLNRPSESGKYPKINRNTYRLIAIKKTNRLYVVSHHKTIYIINAKVNLEPTVKKINRARGERTFHVSGNNQIMAESWINFGKLGYIEAPTMINGKHSKANWFKNHEHLADTIEVSKKDAQWLQQIPNGTTLTVK